MGHGAEVDGDFVAVPAQGLAGTQPEVRAGPAPVVQLEVDLGERLGAVRRFYAFLVDVGGNGAITRTGRPPTACCTIPTSS